MLHPNEVRLVQSGAVPTDAFLAFQSEWEHLPPAQQDALKEQLRRQTDAL